MSVFQNHLPEKFIDFHPHSKVWIYGADRDFTQEEALKINSLMDDFTASWTAHDQALKACGVILYHRFIILAVDETQAHASGCSIDKSVHFIKSIEKLFSLDFFNRLAIIYLQHDELKSVSLSNVNSMVASAEFSPNTLIFDTTIKQLQAFKTEFLKEAGRSWLVKFMD